MSSFVEIIGLCIMLYPGVTIIKNKGLERVGMCDRYFNSCHCLYALVGEIKCIYYLFIYLFNTSSELRVIQRAGGGRWYYGSLRGMRRVPWIHGNYNTSLAERITGLLVTASHVVPVRGSYSFKHHDY